MVDDTPTERDKNYTRFIECEKVILVHETVTFNFIEYLRQLFEVQLFTRSIMIIIQCWDAQSIVLHTQVDINNIIIYLRRNMQY